MSSGCIQILKNKEKGRLNRPFSSIGTSVCTSSRRRPKNWYSLSELESGLVSERLLPTASGLVSERLLRTVVALCNA